MPNRLSRERIDQLFTVYTDRRCVDEVANKCGVSHRTVERYRSLERWDERLDAIQAQASREADYDLARAMADSLRTIRAYKAKLSAAIEAKTISAAEITVADLERLVRLEAFALGAAESRHEVVTTFADWTEEELATFAETGRRPQRTSRSAPRA